MFLEVLHSCSLVVLNDEVKAAGDLEELLILPHVKEILLIIHCPNDHLGKHVKPGCSMEGENLDDPEVLQGLHARHPSTARCL